MQRRFTLVSIVLLLSIVGASGCGPATAEPAPEPEATAPPTPKPTDTMQPSPEPAVPGSVFARDAALAYLGDHYPKEAPAPDLAWEGENLTPEGIDGDATYQYTAEGQIITIHYPMANPREVVYEVVVQNPKTGLRWEGDVGSTGQVTETAIELSGDEPGQEPVAEGGQQDTPPEIGAADLAELAQGNSAFAFDLYQVLKEEEGNLFYSPYSISLALAMTYAGARGETEQQMADTLNFRLPQERLHPAFGALDEALASRGEGAEGKDGEGFRLNIVNDLWGQEGYEFLDQFLDIVDDNYGAELRLLDFVNAPEEARATINDWISEQTEGRIENLLPKGIIDPLTRLVLTNAIYFNAAWLVPFNPDVTQDGAFHLLDGGEVTAPMMKSVGTTLYAEGEDYQAAELLYDGKQLSMVILLPKAGEFEAFEGSLDAAGVESILQNLTPRHVALFLPRFEYESDFSLRETLEALGMPVAFSSNADFSGMTGIRDLQISEVLHKAFVAVDEAGTEAAAATAVIMSRTGMPEESFTFNADRPFLYLIRDIETGAILFVGRVVDPAAS